MELVGLHYYQEWRGLDWVARNRRWDFGKQFKNRCYGIKIGKISIYRRYFGDKNMTKYRYYRYPPIHDILILDSCLIKHQFGWRSLLSNIMGFLTPNTWLSFRCFIHFGSQLIWVSQLLLTLRFLFVYIIRGVCLVLFWVWLILYCWSPCGFWIGFNTNRA